MSTRRNHFENRAALVVAIALAVLLATTFAAPVRVRADLPVVPQNVAGAAASAALAPYQLAPGDNLNITVLGHDDLHASVTLLSDGTFSYPIAGTVHAAGLTVDQLIAQLTKSLSSQLNEPQVTITLSSPRSPKISILGEVHSPGEYDYSPSERLLTALATAGGLAIPESECQVSLMTDGGKQTRAIDIVAVMDLGDSTQNATLSPGDTVLVSERDPAASQVQVIGEVSKPGIYAVPISGSTTLSLLTQAGGPTDKAALSHAEIMHGTNMQIIDLRSAMSNLSSPLLNAVLLPGDVLLIPENKAKIAVLGAVKAPSTYPVPDGDTLTVLDALSLAGGADGDADLKSAMIVRSDPKGQTRQIPLDLSQYVHSGQSAKPSNPVMLQAGDVMYVPTHHGHGGLNLGGLSNLAILSRALLF